MHKRSVLKVAVAGTMFALLATACPSSSNDSGDGSADSSSVLKAVTDRGKVVCGVNDQVPGFGFVDAQGTQSGFDIEFCKVVAAAVLGDATKVEYKALTAEQRFTALQSKEIDVLIRNTTWTATRDGSEGAQFATTTFYDGQGMMVKADSSFQKLEDMAGASVCVLKGTTTELNLNTQFKAKNIAYEPLSLDKNETIQPAFIEGRCDGWTSDKSQLAGIKSAWPADKGGPEAIRILDVTMSKEPLGPVVRDGDTKWFDAVNWAILATIQGEEFKITQANVDGMKISQDPDIQRFLGESKTEAGTSFDAGLGLPTAYAYNVLKQVGNYGEIYDRTVGPSTPLGLSRGLNALWTDGGLHYSPPFR